MSDNTASIQADDAAWASFNTALTADELKEFCRDIERLIRINPLLEFTGWQEINNKKNNFHFTGRNLSTSPPIDVDVDITVDEFTDGFKVNYNGSLKISTTFRIEPVELLNGETGSKLTIIDEYADVSDEERQKRMGEVDKSIVAWANDLQEYIVRWQRWSWCPPWRWYMRRVWQSMKPSGRRIAYMLLWITFAEIIAFILVAIIFIMDIDTFLEMI